MWCSLRPDRSGEEVRTEATDTVTPPQLIAKMIVTQHNSIKTAIVWPSFDLSTGLGGGGNPHNLLCLHHIQRVLLSRNRFNASLITCIFLGEKTASTLINQKTMQNDKESQWKYMDSHVNLFKLIENKGKNEDSWGKCSLLNLLLTLGCLWIKSTKGAVRVSYRSSGLLAYWSVLFQLLTCCNVNLQFRMQD